MELQQGHLYEFGSFAFKNGATPKLKFLLVLKSFGEAGFVGVLSTSNGKACAPYLGADGSGTVSTDNGLAFAYAVQPGVPVTDQGWAFGRQTFFYGEQALLYREAATKRLLEESPYMVDHGVMDGETVERISEMASDPVVANDNTLPYMTGEKALSRRDEDVRRFSRKTDDDLSMFGLTRPQKDRLLRDGVLLFRRPSLPEGGVLLVTAGAAVHVMLPDGTSLGTLAEAAGRDRLLRPGAGGQDPAPDRFPPGALAPYAVKESAIEWLRRHLGGGTAVDRKTMYHLNVINSIIQYGKEIYKRIPSCHFSGLPGGGRRNVAASVILRAGQGPGGEEPQGLRDSGYTRGQELIGHWAERDGCWEDYADKAQADAGRRRIGEGSEAYVYKDDGGWCYKTIDACHYGASITKLMDRISLHNAIFPETAMVVEGFGMRDNVEDTSGFVVTVRQPFVQGGIPDSGLVMESIKGRGFRMPGEDAMKQVSKEIADSGLKVPQFSIFMSFVAESGVRMVDVNDLNAVVSPKGNLLVYDCDLDFHKDPKLGPVHEVPPVEYEEEAVRGIDRLLEDLVPKARPRAEFVARYGGAYSSLAEQLEATGRFEGIIEGPGPGDRWLVAVNPEDKREVLVLPQRSARLMTAMLPPGELTAAQRADVIEGRRICRGGRIEAFDLDKGRVAAARPFALRQRHDVTVDHGGHAEGRHGQRRR